MYYHLILTDECNLNCSYCRGKDYFSFEAESESHENQVFLPAIPGYTPENLYEFLKKDSDPAVLFYGGEPTLKSGLIRDFIDNMPSCRFSIYTNGLLIRNLSPEYIRRLDTIILSIDGDRETTDGYRGEGVYDSVMNNLDYLCQSGFSGEIIGRITVAENSDIYNSVIHLSENENHPFNSIHWQMDANFWYDFNSRPGFQEWIDESYNPGVFRLIKKWLHIIKNTGHVPRWYPFCGLVYDILTGASGGFLRCGAGHMNYAIQTDGNIIPCPCMSGMKDYYCGNIFESDPGRLKKIGVGGECFSCEIRDFCGGRCLYSNIVSPWPDDGIKLVYKSIINLKFAVESVIPDISEMIEEDFILTEDFHINKYNGCEIIP